MDRRDFLKKGTGAIAWATTSEFLSGENAAEADANEQATGTATLSGQRDDAESSRVAPYELRLAEQWFQAIRPTGEGQLPSQTWLDGWLSTSLPFSFAYGGKPIDSLLPGWRFREGNTQHDSAGQRNEIIWSDPAGGLQLRWELKCFAAYPAVEWLLWFENVGSKDTLVIEDIQDLSLNLTHSKQGEPYIVHGAHGGRYKRDDWWPISAYLPSNIGRTPRYEDGTQIEFGGAYPSSRRNLPFINIETPENRGCVLAVGWTGNWTGHLKVDKERLTARAGLKETHFVLHPGERVRTSRILVLLWEGKRLHAHNMLRSILHKHYIPALRRKPQEPMVSVNACFTYNGKGGFLTEANQKNLVPLVNPCSRLGTEVFIVDAGWYPGAPWNRWMGNWTCSKERYPNGFPPLSEPLAASKIDFGVWFAPEVVCDTVPLYREHPELLNKTKTAYGGANLRLDLPEAREWFLKQVDDLVENQGMTCYRQDGYNSEADCHSEDTTNRIGVGEIKYIMGFYDLLDTLRKRHPALVMEAAAGAARIDLETLSRYHWHQPCETWLHPDLDQCTTYGTSLWIPGGMIVFYNSMTGTYGAWSAFGGQLSLAIDPTQSSFPMEWTRQQVEVYKRVRAFLSGDFYPLTPISLDGTWMGYQYHRADLDGGFAVIFKRSDSSQDIFPAGNTFNLQLRGLDRAAKYRTRFESNTTEKTVAGEELRGGINISLGKAPSAELITYNRAG